MEMARVELASENPSAQLSTSVVKNLHSPSRASLNRLSGKVAALFMTGYATLTRSRSLLLDALSRAAVLPGRTAA